MNPRPLPAGRCRQPFAAASLCLLLLGALLAGGRSARAGEFKPAPYYSLNPYDDMVIGPGFTAQGTNYRMEMGVGYSLTQHEGRMRIRYRGEKSFIPGLGYDLFAFHEVQARSDLVPLFQTGFYEGRTGGAASLFYHLSPNALGTFSVISDKLWALPLRANLWPTTSDRILAFRLGYQRDARDDRMNPRSGGSLDFGLTQAVGVLGTTRAYLSSYATWTGYRAIGAAESFAFRAHAAATAGNVPIQRQIWLPGEGVRGYDFVTNNGDAAGVLNAELRVPMIPDENLSLGSFGTLQRLQLAAFADAGTVHTPGDCWRIRGGIGLGVRAPMMAFGQVPMVLRVDAAQGLMRTGRLKSYLTLTAPELF